MLKFNIQRCTEARQKLGALENTRAAKVARIRADIDRIRKREMEYAKTLFEVLVPVKVSWDEDAWNRIKEIVPVRVEPIVSSEESDDDDQSL